MDQIDAFPEHISTTVMPVTLPKKPDALVYAARLGHVRACILYQEPNTKRVFVLFCKDHWHQKKTLVDNFKRAILESKHVNEFRPDDVLWEKISKGMLRNPDRLLKNTDKRMVYIYNNMFFVKKDFTFSFRTVKSGEIHLIQTTHVPMLIYEFPSSNALSSNGVGTPHGIPDPGWNPLHLVDGAKDNVWFGHYPRNDSPQLMENGFNLGDFRQRKLFDQKAYKLPPPTPAHVPPQTNRRPLEQQPKPLCKKKRVIITPIIRPSVAPVMIIKLSTALSTPQPVSIPEPPEQTTHQILLPDPPSKQTTPQILLPDPPSKQTTPQILLPDQPSKQTTPQILLPHPPVVETTSQILLPDPPSKQTTSQILLPDPPVVETLEPTLTDDSSIDQIMSSVFGDYLHQGIPSAHIQEPQVLDTVPSLFDARSHLDLTWDQGVELRFFQVGRSPSHCVWEAYQPHMTDACSVDLTDCLRVANVYVKWLTWLDDWEMHRHDPVPWRMVGLQPWKRALEQHVQLSHENALAHGMPSDVKLLDNI
ncbi:uncharacterized protein TNCV_2472271 [Trichonephila clavipes]|nr:uncharacterized protein TNCV_2472271 [Trichonephila clavipes]